MQTGVARSAFVLSAVLLAAVPGFGQVTLVDNGPTVTEVIHHPPFGV